MIRSEERLRRDRMGEEKAAEQCEVRRMEERLRRDRMGEEEAAEEREWDAAGQRARRQVLAITAENLPRLFEERPTCVCDSCQRTFYCSRHSGARPQPVRIMHGCICTGL